MAEQRTGGSILTFSGVTFWPLDPRPEEVVLIDIAHALSHLCRFTGHVRTFYSVAEHCCRVHDLLLHSHVAGHAAWGLMHDATEAYLGDVARPTKRAEQGFGAAYRVVEQRLAVVIAERFDLRPRLEPPAVKGADDRLLATEQRDLMPASLDDLLEWPSEEPLEERIDMPWSPWRAKNEFAARAVRLGIGCTPAVQKGQPSNGGLQSPGSRPRLPRHEIKSGGVG